MYLVPMSDPPHQNSVRLVPCRKMAAIQGHWPVGASMPPTIRPDEYSCCPQSAGSTMLSIGFSVADSRAPSEPDGATVYTGTSGRLVVVVGVGFVTGASTRLGATVAATGGGRGFGVVSCVLLLLIGQQTPGTKRLLKHSDSRRWLKSSSSPGQVLKSSQRPGQTTPVVGGATAGGVVASAKVSSLSSFRCATINDPTVTELMAARGSGVLETTTSGPDVTSPLPVSCSPVPLPTRLISGSIVFVRFLPSIVFVSVSSASGTVSFVSGSTCVMVLASWPLVMFTMYRPTVLRAPSVSDSLLNAASESKRARTVLVSTGGLAVTGVSSTDRFPVSSERFKCFLEGRNMPTP
uniref:Uncharacterized protein n=1 Tax=Anopheles atroparvus TaxID=41427 RepID=A0A182IXQ0_ANOAO